LKALGPDGPVYFPFAAPTRRLRERPAEGQRGCQPHLRGV